ncbi:MAG: trehalose-phosphatase [Burkholderiaceae bacterium]
MPVSAALFLDFDGTLVALAERPQDVHVSDWVVPALKRLHHGLQGALAVVSGRPLGVIDAYLHPLVLAAAGAHGVERRDSTGLIERHPADPPADVVLCAAELAARHTGLILEMKPSGFALHFRQHPDLGELCREALADAVADTPGVALHWELLHGHCVYELKQRAVSKGTAVQAFLADRPFAGRVPVFIGDDVTDEDGIWAVQAAGGFGIRVGPGASQAHYRLADTDAVATWLQAAARATVAHAEERNP